MKVLWFLPIPPAAEFLRHNMQPRGTGFWIHSLLNQIEESNGIQLSIAYLSDALSIGYTYGKTAYYPILNYKARRLISLIPHLERHCISILHQKAKKLIHNLKPDIIHVHGTESPFSYLPPSYRSGIPLVISIQGLWDLYAKHVYGGRSSFNILKMQSLREVAGGLQLLRLQKRYYSLGKFEHIALKDANGIIGRTTWDKSYAWSVAPKTAYFHVDEIMRKPFYIARWKFNNCIKHRVYTSGRLTLLKGIHTILHAIHILKNDYPDITLHIAGNKTPTAEFRYFSRLVNNLNLPDNVKFTGWIDANAITKELLASHVYANPSFIENGCNALQEAMLMGLPCVAPFTGGIATTIEHRKTGLMFPYGDSIMLAYRIKELFENRNLAENLGCQAQIRAYNRHAPRKITQDLLNVYCSVAHKTPSF